MSERQTYEQIRAIGEGGMGKVYLLRGNNDGKFYAVKTVVREKYS